MLSPPPPLTGSKRTQWKNRGQKSVTRPLIGTYDTSDVAIQERRRQQQRFREAQLIQREMSQLDRQYEELEEVGRNIEQCLRDADGSELLRRRVEGGKRREKGGEGGRREGKEYGRYEH